jgi:hypothetical protein
MANLKQVLKAIDKRLNEIQPRTMDDFLQVVHSTEGMENYGSHFAIVQYMGSTQGVRAYITGRKKSHPLPAQKGHSYGVFKGLEKYIQAGWKIELPDGTEI